MIPIIRMSLDHYMHLSDITWAHYLAWKSLKLEMGTKTNLGYNECNNSATITFQMLQKR